MPEPFVTVAKYSVSLEAEMAKSFLENEGIAVQLTGDLTPTMLPIGSIGGQAQLQVREADAERAAALLADHFDKRELNDNWKDEAEADPDVWVCSLCGEPVNKELLTCTACQTPREAVQTQAAQPLRRRRQHPADKWHKGIRKHDEMTGTPPWPERLTTEREADQSHLNTFLGDDLAKRAFFTAIFGFFLPPLWLYSTWCLLRLMLFPGALSPNGTRHVYIALALNALVYGGVLFLWARFQFGR